MGKVLLRQAERTVGKEWTGHEGAGYVIPLPPTSADGGGIWIPFSVTVTTAGTPVQLSATSVPCKKLIICSPTGTGSAVAAVGGNNTVRATSGAVVGIELVPGNTPLVMDTDDIVNIWVDSRVNGGKVCGAYLT